MKQEFLELIERKKKILESIKEKELEHKRIQEKIDQLEGEKELIFVEVQKCFEQINEVGEKMLELEYNSLIKNDK